MVSLTQKSSLSSTSTVLLTRVNFHHQYLLLLLLTSSGHILYNHLVLLVIHNEFILTHKKPTVNDSLIMIIGALVKQKISIYASLI